MLKQPEAQQQELELVSIEGLVPEKHLLRKIAAGVDLLNARGEIVLRRKCSRKQLLQFTSNRQTMLIGMEACGGAHFLARALRTQGTKPN